MQKQFQPKNFDLVQQITVDPQRERRTCDGDVSRAGDYARIQGAVS